MAYGADVVRVGSKEHGAACVAKRIEALNGNALSVEYLGAVVNLETAYRGEAGAALLDCIIRRLSHGNQCCGILTKVLVNALLAELVIALDGLVEILLVNAGFLGKFIN